MYALFLFYILLLNFLIFLTLSISAEYAGLFVIALAIAISCNSYRWLDCNRKLYHSDDKRPL